MEKHYSSPQQNSNEAAQEADISEQALNLDAAEKQALRSLYDLDSIEDLRRIEATLGTDSPNAEVPDFMKKVITPDADETRKHNIDTYLGLYGVDETHVAYERAYNDVDTFLSVPEREWFVARPELENEDTHEKALSGRDIVRFRYADLTGEGYYGADAESRGEDAAQAETPVNTPVEILPPADVLPPTTPLEAVEVPSVEEAAVSEEAEKLTEIRAKLARLNAKRQGRLWTGKRAQAEYAEVQAEYNEQLQALGKQELAETLEDASKTELEKNAAVIAFLFDQQAKLRTQSKEAFEKTLVSKGIEWMNSGTRLQRFGKAALIGVAAAGVGAGIGLVAGAAGAGALGAGIAATVTAGTRFARGYARSDAKKGRGLAALNRDEHTKGALEHVAGEDARVEEEYAERLEAQRASELPQFGSEPVEPTEVEKPEARDSFALGQEYFDTALELDTKAEQKKRRRAVAVGAAVLAIGSGAGIALHAASDLYDATAGAAPTPGPVETPSTGTGVESPFSDTFDADGGADTAEAAPAAEVTDEMRGLLDQDTGVEGDYVAESTHMPEIEYDPAFNINAGTGGIEFFQSVGLSESDWYAAAPELAEKFPTEFYNDGVDIRIMNTGSLSLEAQNYIKTRFGFFG